MLRSESGDIHISFLATNVYFSISHCKTIKIMLDALPDLYEEIGEVKHSKSNTLIKECELFHMEPI